MTVIDKETVKRLIELNRKEGFEIEGGAGIEAGGGEVARVRVYDFDFPLVHPAAIHLKLYRDITNAELKYKHMKRAHDLIWPNEIDTWNYWQERCFQTHCEGWKVVTYAGGSSLGKSFTAAKIADLFWLANPKKRAVLVMSTTLESLNSRIYGYCLRFIDKSAVAFPVIFRAGTTPKILFPKIKGKSTDELHSISAVAAKKGDSDTAISSLIGRHPEEGLMIVADECTDLPISLLDAIPNLSAGGLTFQLLGIGNSNSKFDLHGSLSTPRVGWKNIDPLKINKWETTQKGGVCLYFNPYESPAIWEENAEKKARLAKFLFTAEKIEEKKKEYGEKSSSFARFVLGFWKDDIEDNVIISSRFLSEFNYGKNAEWSGLKELKIVAGLDIAFSSGGDNCVLQLGVLGEDVRGRMLLDFRGTELQFKIEINPFTRESAEMQVADKVIEILRKFNVDLRDLCMDATGQGRAMGELLRLRGKYASSPVKIFSVGQGNRIRKTNSFDMLVRTPLELWGEVKAFLQTDQLRGIGNLAAMQFTSRLIVVNQTTRKQVLENKQAFKRRMGAIMPVLGKSPDEADAISLCLQAAINNYGFHPNQMTTVRANPDFYSEKMRAFQLEAAGAATEEKKAPGVSILSGFGTSLEDTAGIKLPFT